jgi:hypothetical protein
VVRGLAVAARVAPPEVESAEPLPEVRPLVLPPDELPDGEDGSEDEDDVVEDASVPLPLPLVSLPAAAPELELLDPVEVLAVASASACEVPTRTNTPAAAAGVTAAATAAVRRASLRTAAAVPRSLLARTVPLRSDSVSRPTVGERPGRSL